MKDSTGRGKFERLGLDVNIRMNNNSVCIVDGITVSGETDFFVNSSVLTIWSGAVNSYMGTSLSKGSEMNVLGGTLDSSRGISVSSDSVLNISAGNIVSYYNCISSSGSVNIRGGSFKLRDDDNPYYNKAIFEINGGDLNITDGFFDNTHDLI